MITENKITEITERIAKLKSNVLSSIPAICTERAGFYTEIYKESGSSPEILKRAYALEKTLKKMTIFISEGELIVGNQSSKLRAAPIFPEYGTSWILKELDEFDKKPGDAYFINDRQKEELKRICDWWNGKAPEGITSGDSQFAVNYEKILEKGLKGYLQSTESQQDTLNVSDNRFFEKQDFCNSLIIGIKAIQSFIERFEKLSYEMAECETEPARKAELFRISEICGNITENPPSRFYEALQLTWFIQLILQIESNGNSVSLGRMDQYLYRFYKNDLIAGKITKEFTLELLENTWIKLISINKIRPISHSHSAGSAIYQNVTIGGQTKEGNDAMNELSYLILDSVERMKLTQPNLSVRFHTNTNDDFLDHGEGIIARGFGMRGDTFD